MSVTTSATNATSAAPPVFAEANRRYLLAALAVVRDALDRHAARQVSMTGQTVPESAAARVSGDAGDTRGELVRTTAAMPAPAALETLCQLFALSHFECDVLLLCAGLELDPTFAARCAAAQGDPHRVYPTFSLALAALPDAHWSALTPAAPLRSWRLIELLASDTLLSSPLRIDERVLHFLTGTSYLDERLRPLIEPLELAGELPPSHQALAERIAHIWSRTRDGSWPAIQLCGDEYANKRAIVASACHALGIRAYALAAVAIPQSAPEREALVRLWEREAILSGSVLLLDCEEVDGVENMRSAVAFVESGLSPLVLTSREPLRVRHRAALRLDVQKPAPSEQRAFWARALGPAAAGLDGRLDELAMQFNLGQDGIAIAAREALDGWRAADVSSDTTPLAERLWLACREQARPRLDDLAQRIEPAATWEDLILPDAQRQMLRDIAAHVRRRATVYEAWGFAGKGARGLGISALFVGASGTGKTMAAEVLAGTLRLDLYRIDLSSVVSKYIGETEKNLRRVFDAAEEGGTILLFDEADALFGKRSEVKDSHDRYANIEVSYLLQRMEAYRGLAILTTNMKSALDTAFLRRIRFVVQFPFPDVAQRTEIWRRIYPAATPTRGLDVAKLARLNIPGGNIRAIALNAAFLAAEAGEPVTMAHLLRATRAEFDKLEKPLTDAEIGGWV